MRLPVVQGESDRESIARDLRGLVGVDGGSVRFGAHDRALYSTDASLYQVEPLGVVVPGSVAEAARVVGYCRDRGLGVLARGGGTSLAGQCVSRGVVLDFSAMCRGVRRVDFEARVCEVDAGIYLDELNERLLEAWHSAGGEAAVGEALFFAPDPATSRQATVGGCIGNNAAGSRSVRYRRTSENVNGVECLLASGERVWLEAGAGARDPVARRLAEGVLQVVGAHADLIRERFPKTIRRNAGYGLDLVLAQLDAGATAETVDLSGLLCGSEGTLAVTLGARLKLHPMPPSRGLAVVAFDSVEAAIGVVSAILETAPTAVELLDDMVLDAARGNTEHRRYVELLPSAEAMGVLYVEYSGTDEAIESGFERLRGIVGGAPMATHRDPKAMLGAWRLRKAGEPLLHGLSGERKPLSFVEDNAVPVERLGEFVARFKRIVASHGTRAAFWAHASVGVLHVRPMLDLHDEADRLRMRAMAVEVADLARACGGVMSGEHGDGRARGPLLERFYGAELMEAFRSVKRIFDPTGMLNPGNIVGGHPLEHMTTALRTRPRGDDVRVPEVETFFDYSDQEGFAGAVEMCNGSGVCRKRQGGTMCPSYHATMDERHSTRGRGNALRLAISGQLGEAGVSRWNDAGTKETLDLCLSCKACKSECPSNVDISRLKAEYTAQRYRERGGAPFRARVMGHVRALNRLGSVLPGVSNVLGGLSLSRAMMSAVLGVDRRRSLPRFERSLAGWMSRRKAGHAPGAPKVVLFGDCFTMYNEPRIGRASVEVLEGLGYEVVLADAGCCGRSLISMGLLREAREAIEATATRLGELLEDDRVRAIVVCEPSCLSALKDDWRELKTGVSDATLSRIASISWLVEDFVSHGGRAEGSTCSHPKPLEARLGGDGRVLLHGHCHQKALWGAETSRGALADVAPDRVEVLETGCCGLAGSFGYTRERFDLSMRIGELSLLPAVRARGEGDIIAAPGTSCRHQIKDGTGAEALHPIEVIARAMKETKHGAS